MKKEEILKWEGLLSDMSRPHYTTWVMSEAVIGGFGFLAFLVCVAVSYDSVAGEFENGHVKTLLTKPLAKSEFYMGKYLACSLLVISALLLLTGVGASGYLIFESQELRGNLIPVFGTVVYSSLPFLSIVFAVGTITKKSAAAVIVTFLVFFVQQFMYFLPGTIGQWITKLMPTVAMQKLLTTAAGLQSSPTAGSFATALVSTIIYIIAPLLIGLYHLNTTDISP
ncbi:hypothetical protein AKJ39_03335 [candidate division MSBL1 archaeon SCGC-AAA259J03]|uniref:ABC transporter permease n=1 Tax=candidate division MSBL1 archaeon SCGC-AAA259J03 TaxID=1698269 RepID=A0A656YVM3_9EURY|nr:hypothetical protein AKJ39_03335 [candidate division MSBL1 archaeon SCGC-AAA259J03]